MVNTRQRAMPATSLPRLLEACMPSPGDDRQALLGKHHKLLRIQQVRVGPRAKQRHARTRHRPPKHTNTPAAAPALDACGHPARTRSGV